MDLYRTLTLAHRYHYFLNCIIIILIPLIQLKTILCWEKNNLAGTIIMKTVKAPKAKPISKPLPGDKTLVIEPDIHFYEK